MHSIAELTAGSPTFAGLDRRQIDVIAGCGATARFEAGELLFRAGQGAERFYLVRHGTVALELPAPGREPLVIETLHDGEIAGFSWLFAPHRWVFDARAAKATSAIGFDCACLRGKCDVDHELGYELMRRFAATLVDRLQAARLQLLDVYGRSTVA
jgi:CRP/FNR family transcriptional regulator, cyclic AMP receptor protein